MEISKQDIEQILARFFRRAKAARLAGGISRQEAMEGIQVPEGWRPDEEVDYWLPPNIRLL